jgi:hypothetical protein
VKQHLLIGCDTLLIETLNQALKLEAAKAAVGSPVRLQEGTKAPTRTPVHHINLARMYSLYAGGMGMPVTSEVTAGRGRLRKSAGAWEVSRSQCEEGATSIIAFIPSFHTQCTGQGD